MQKLLCIKQVFCKNATNGRHALYICGFALIICHYFLREYCNDYFCQF